MPKTSTEQFQQFQEYTNYIDTSDVLLGFYKNESGTGLEKYYLMIEEWLGLDIENQEDNKPLVIEAEGGVGKKTLLVKWYEYHQALKQGLRKDLIILNFATTGGNTSNYFYAIYRILIKLREELNIRQKVELHQEKLRKYFSYWLDVCNQRIENQAVQNSDIIYEKIILVFEGVDYFLDRGSNKEGNLAFWLPRCFPKNVKVIVTADRESESMRYFENLCCRRVSIPSDDSIIKTMIKWQNQKQLCVQGQFKAELIGILEANIKNAQVTSLYVKAYLSCLLPEKLTDMPLSDKSLAFIRKALGSISKDKLRNFKNVSQLFEYLLEFWSCILFDSQHKFQQLIGLLISTQKGLTLNEIMAITKIDSEQLKLFITIFRVFLMNFKNLWMIKNDSFKRSIFKIFTFTTHEINQKIAEALKKTPNSVRKLEEQTFQLYSAGNYFKLKEVISDIENFLLLFNPYTKYDLCRYWQKLEERSFDPVIEYNKAIEGFDTHYHPSPDDLFRIITQISRFLKEFSDFETYYTPEFRHPKLIGNSKQLDDIGILGQFRNLSLCEDSEEPPLDQQRMLAEGTGEAEANQCEKKLERKLKEMYLKLEQGQGKMAGKPQKQAEVKIPVNVIEKKKFKPIRIQQLNVEVKNNEEGFRNHYFSDIRPFLVKVGLEGKEEAACHLHERDSDYEDSDNEAQSESIVTRMKIIQAQRQKPRTDLPNLKDLYATTVEEEFQLTQKPPTNYYYKRWIWMQFPWVCMSMKSDYSEKLRKCFTSPTSYMSVSEERQFTLQALKIALEAKKKKQEILQRHDDKSKITTIHRSSSRQPNESSATRLANSSSKKKKIEELSFITNSFLSLHNLSKEIDSIKMSQGTVVVQNNDNSVFLTSNDKSISLIQDYSSILPGIRRRKRSPEAGEGANTSQQGLLPRIKQSATNEVVRQLNQLEKNNAQMRRQVDTFLYKNKQLAKRLKELKIIQFNNLGKIKDEKRLEERKRKIMELNKRIERVKMGYAYSLLESQRLDVLIRICRSNKTTNEETIPELGLECSNFKKMIRIETECIQDLRKKTEEIKKLTRKFVSNTCEKIQNEQKIARQVKQTEKNMRNFLHQIDRYDEMIIEEIENKRRQLTEQPAAQASNKEELTSVPDRMRKTNALSEDEDYGLIYAKVNGKLNLDDENYRECPAYYHLLSGLSKKREFEVAVAQRRLQLNSLRHVYAEERKQLQTIQRAREQCHQSDSNEDADEDYEPDVSMVQQLESLKKELAVKKRQLGKLTDLRLSCTGMLEQCYSKLSLNDQPGLTITGQFVTKVRLLVNGALPHDQ